MGQFEVEGFSYVDVLNCIRVGRLVTNASDHAILLRYKIILPVSSVRIIACLNNTKTIATSNMDGPSMDEVIADSEGEIDEEEPSGKPGALVTTCGLYFIAC